MADGTEESAGLMDRLKAGDPHALGDGFSQHWAQLRRMVAARLNPRLNSRLSASDVLQEAYIDALKRLPHFLRKPDMPFFGWLCLIVDQRLAEVHRYHLGTQRRDASQETRLPLDVARSETSSERDTTSGASLAARLIGQLTSPSQAALRNEAPCCWKKRSIAWTRWIGKSCRCDTSRK